jgi:hypothetical protein
MAKLLAEVIPPIAIKAGRMQVGIAPNARIHTRRHPDATPVDAFFMFSSS